MAETKFLDNVGLTHLFEKINAKFSKLGHKHTKADITDFAHNHNDLYYGKTDVDSKLSGKSNTSHNHDDRYYTESEINAKLAAETKARTDADTALDAAYKAADTALGSRIDNAEAEISANSADLTGIKGLTYGSEHVQFIENENGSYTSPALEEIAGHVTALETAGWSDIRGKPFSTIGSGLKVVSDALTVDASAISAGITGNTTWGEIEQP